LALCLCIYISSYLSFSGFRRAAPHETLIDEPQVLLPVAVRLVAVHMRATCGTHGAVYATTHTQRGATVLLLAPPPHKNRRPPARWSKRLGYPGLRQPLTTVPTRLPRHVLFTVVGSTAGGSSHIDALPSLDEIKSPASIKYQCLKSRCDARFTAALRTFCFSAPLR